MKTIWTLRKVKALLSMLAMVFTLVIILLSSCTSDNEKSIKKKPIIIASKTVNCTGVIEQKCFYIKTSSTNNWELFYDVIIGFEYEEGYEFELLVSEEDIVPVADGSSIKTSLIRVMSKIKKESEGLPI